MYRPALGRWLELTRVAPLFWHALVSIGIFSGLLALAVLTRLVVPDSISIGTALVLAWMLLLSLIAPASLTAAALWRPLEALRGALTIGPPESTRMVVSVAASQMSHVIEDVRRMTREGVTWEASRAMLFLNDRGFAVSSADYISTDRHVPSEFLSQRSEILEAQSQYLRKTKNRNSVRILLVDQQALKVDARLNPVEYREFLNWHNDNHVRLVTISPIEWEDRRRTMVNGSALWLGEYIVLWEDLANGLVNLRLAFAGDYEYDRCIESLSCVEHRLTLPPDVDSIRHPWLQQQRSDRLFNQRVAKAS